MSNFQIHNVSGTNIQQGDYNTQNITISQADRDQLTSLLATLHQQIQEAPIPPETKKQLAEQVLPAMTDAAKQPDPKPGLTAGLQSLNANLQTANTAASSVAGIVGTVVKIAGIIGTGIHFVAPFLAGLL